MSILTAAASIAWALASFEVGDFKHRQLLVVTACTSRRFVMLIVFRLCEVLARVTTLAILAAYGTVGSFGAACIGVEMLGLLAINRLTNRAARYHRQSYGSDGGVPAWAW